LSLLAACCGYDGCRSVILTKPAAASANEASGIPIVPANGVLENRVLANRTTIHRNVPKQFRG
jgi:hypothetical protein